MTAFPLSITHSQHASTRQIETRLENAIAAFAPISLREMDAVSLLNRVDTKFVFSTAQLADVLYALLGEYRVLAINGKRMHNYRTMYYDTPAFDLYHRHVTQQADIVKVRSREYLDTHLSYLEVKHKDHKKRTDKRRTPITGCAGALTPGMQQYLRGAAGCDCQCLEPKLCNAFTRITLVSKTRAERLTIDIDLSFSHDQRALNLPGVVIAEVKQDHYNNNSAFLREMHRLGIRQTGFSKYCFGVAQLYDGVKKNAIKPKVLMVEKIQRGAMSYVCNA